MKNHQKPVTRRDFLRGTVGATLTVSMLGVPWLKGNAHASGSSSVFVVRDKDVLDSNLKVDKKRLQIMLDQTILQVTGKNKIKEAWTSLIKPDDIVGLVSTPHLNPTHPELFDVIKNTLVPSERRARRRGRSS